MYLYVMNISKIPTFVTFLFVLLMLLKTIANSKTMFTLFLCRLSVKAQQSNYSEKIVLKK